MLSTRGASHRDNCICGLFICIYNREAASPALIDFANFQNFNVEFASAALCCTFWDSSTFLKG